MIKNFIALLVLLFAMASCKSQDVPVESKVTVWGESLLMNEDGSFEELPLLRAEDLSTEKGSITGLGEYDADHLVTVRAERKADYILYEFYEVNEKGDFSRAKGRVNETKTDGAYKKVKDVSCEISFRVNQDMRFRAVFIKASESESSYDVKVNGSDQNIVDNYLPKGETKTYTVSGTKTTPIKNGEGVIVENKVENYSDWSVTDDRDWITTTLGSDGQLQVTASPNTAPGGGFRSGTVRVGKGNDFVTITVNQDWEGTEDVIIDDSDNEVSVGDLPNSIRHEFLPKGSSIDIRDKAPALKKTLYVAKVRKNSSGTTYVEKVALTVEYKDASDSWVSRSSYNYTAQRNTTGKERNTEASILIKKNTDTVKTINVSFVQKSSKFIVDGEIQ